MKKLLVLMLGFIVGCESEPKSPTDIYNKIKSSNSYEEAKKYYPKQVTDFYDGFDKEKQEKIFARATSTKDYQTEEVIRGEQALLLVYGGDMRSEECVYAEKGEDSKWSLKLFGSPNYLSFDALKYRDPTVFENKGGAQYNDKAINANYAIAESRRHFDSLVIDIEFFEELTSGDLELSMTGSTKAGSTSNSPKFTITVFYSEDGIPSMFNINLMGVAGDNVTAMHGVSADEAIQDFEVDDSSVRIVSKGSVISHEDAKISWNIDTEAPLLIPKKCEEIFSSILEAVDK